MVSRINAQHAGARPVIYYQAAPFLTASQRAAIWSVGEVLACTPIREGMNAFPLEYISVHHFLPPETLPRGVVIISEFTAPARVLSGALYVNPWSVLEVRAAYRKALTIAREERAGRFAKLETFVLSNPTSTWITRMLAAISSVRVDKETREVSLGFGYYHRVIEMSASFALLSSNVLGTAWLRARRRAVFLDYGGTLVDQDNYRGIDRLRAIAGQGSFRSPPPGVQEALTAMSSCEGTWVFIVSGRSREEVEQSMQAVPYLGLAAEEGFFYRMPSKWGRGDAETQDDVEPTHRLARREVARDLAGHHAALLHEHERDVHRDEGERGAVAVQGRGPSSSSPV